MQAPLVPIARHVEHAMNAIMAILLFAMMAVTAIDVVGRYLLNTPVPGGFEIVQYLMAVVIFASLPLTTGAERHLSVSILENRLRGTTRRVYRAVILLVSLAALAVIAWRMGVQASVLGRSQQVSGFLQLPLAPIAWIMTALATLAALVALVKLLADLCGRDAFGHPPSAQTGID
ncbi:MAG: TRAP transporter small permease, partial [Pseudorhodoplanes sp.]